jgi:riboflavin biosynthesis pyrimidine reductase
MPSFRSRAICVATGVFRGAFPGGGDIGVKLTCRRNFVASARCVHARRLHAVGASEVKLKPYVICHMCSTIDGKILSRRWRSLPGGRAAANLFEPTAAKFGIGAWLVGTTTMKEFAAGAMRLPRATRKIGPRDFIADPKATRLAIGADAKAQLRFKKSEVDGDHVVLLITEQVPGNYLAHLQDAGVSYIFCGRKQIDLKVALDKLARAFKLRKLMLQGGGTFNGAMLAIQLIDEISLVIVPIVDGGKDVTSVFQIPGKTPTKAAAGLKLMSEKRLSGGAKWLRYRVAQ